MPSSRPTEHVATGAPTPAQALLQIFNLRAIAAVFYLCLLMASARALNWYVGGEEDGPWLYSLVHYTRQTLLTGLSVLLLLALAEAWLVRLPARPQVVRGLAIVLGALLGTFARIWVSKWDDPNARMPWGWVISTTTLWSLLGGTCCALLQMARSEREARRELLASARRREQLHAQQLEAQLLALNAQIEPHFLFNTLANVKRLYETAPERGRDMLVSLIAYLRAALPSMRRGESTLGQELALVRSYLTILQMRMGERLAFEIEAEPGLLEMRLPPMVLPTLVENAIKHGLAPLPEGGRILIRARRRADELALEVRDNGQGFAASSGTGVGLANTRARLAALFGARAALELEAAAPRGVVARLRLPCEEVAQ